MKTEMYTYIENRQKTVLPTHPAFERWLDPDKTAIICIDMHRGHVGPDEQLTSAAPRARAKIPAHNAFHTACREIGIPIIFAQLTLRGSGIDATHSKSPLSPWSPFLLYPLYLPPNPLLEQHSLEGTKWLDLMVENDPERDYYIRTKKRNSCFYATDLEFLLRQLDVENVAITGTYTDACDLVTAYDACDRDFRVIVPRDIVAGYKKESEDAALMLISLHVGIVTDSLALLAEWYARKDRKLPDRFRDVSDLSEAVAQAEVA